MKRKIFPSFIILVLSFTSAKAQWITIPDTAFVTYLNQYYSACMNGNQMDTSCSGIVYTTTVDCNGYNLKSFEGVQYFDNLWYLSCPYAQLSYLPPLPKHLVYLNLYSNELDSLPTLPNSITAINCAGNNITSLPALPLSLRALHCSHNPLYSLPALPDSLHTLDCTWNWLNSLPALPDSLTSIDCSSNQLTYLPALPERLININCSGNQLTQLPALPISLRQIDCQNNLLTGLPEIPDSLTNIYCPNNQLASLPKLPDYLYSLVFFNNPISCFPPFKRIDFLNFDSTNITCMPDYGSVGYSSPILNSLPLCEEFNASGCPVYYTIRGKVYLDTDNNCQPGVTETLLRNVTINLFSGNTLINQTTPKLNGEYSFLTPGYGTYTIRADSLTAPFNVSCPMGGWHTSVITQIDSLDSDKDFALVCRTGFDLTAQSLAGRFRPGAVSELLITAGDFSNFSGANCIAGTGGTVMLVMGGDVSYVSPISGGLSPYSVVGDTVLWVIPDFGTINFFSDFNSLITTSNTAQFGERVCFTLIVNPVNGDNNPLNNTLTQCFTIVGSFDPNDKTAYPTGNIDTVQKELTYTIRFQNTGTAEAIHIHIDDTLDTDLDASTFQLLAYSHQPLIQIKDRAVRFNFPNINLPDSNTNEPLSHGYVQYKVKLKESLPIGTTIHNTAFIYFDFNAPVVTNTTTNTITINTGISAAATATANFLLFPNPASSSVTVSVPEELIGSTLTVTDIMGREINSVLLSTVSRQLSTESFANGIYFVSIRKNGVVFSKKLVVQR